MRVAEWMARAEEQLASAGIASARLEASVILSHVLGTNRTWVAAHPDDWFDPDPADALIARRLAAEPLAYLVGYREFYGRRFLVNREVLVPRQDTEILVEAALEWLAPEPRRVLDLGAGSGCIGITLALERPSWRVTLADISPGAVNLCRENAAELGARVDVVQGDGIPEGRWDVLVSNPPYVETGAGLPKEIAEYEPAEALFAGPDGLDFYRRLATECTGIRQVLLEVGRGQDGAVVQLFEAAGYGHYRTWEDLAGIPRVLGFELP